MSNTWDSLHIVCANHFASFLQKEFFALAVPDNGDQRKFQSYSIDRYNNLRLASFPSAENTKFPIFSQLV